MQDSKYHFFYGGPFSQWHDSSFVDSHGITYNCAEQFMMAKKALMFNDLDAYAAIMFSYNPKEQKALGKLVKHFNKAKWNTYCRGIVKEANFYKFTQNPILNRYMYDLRDKTLVEASPYDDIWGIGLGVNDPRALDEKQWLGIALMEAREEITVRGLWQ